MLHELPFYDGSNIVKITEAFKRYARSYEVEIIELKDPLVQLEKVVKDLLKDLLYEIKGFKYQMKVKLLLKKSTNQMET